MIFLWLVVSGFLFVSSAWAFDASLSDNERAYIGRALEMMNMNEQQLGFEKRWATDSLFRFPIVDTLMNKPLYCFDYADICAAMVESLDGDVAGLLEFEIDRCGLSENVSSIKGVPSIVGQKPMRGLPADIARGLSAVLASFEEADISLTRAFMALSDDEKSRILMIVPTLWSDEDDSTDDYLAGILHREFGAEVDTSEEVKTDTLLAISKKVNMAELGHAGLKIALGMEKAKIELGRRAKRRGSLPGSKSVPDVDGGVIYSELTRWGRVVIGGSGDNTYHGDFAIIIDIGGDDRYFCRAGGAVGILDNPFSVVIDINGNDLYSSEKLFNIGSGIFGVGGLLDLEGDDTYRASHYSFGTGIYGVGIMYDGEGNDLYEGGFCVQGAGNFGFGLQVDMSGDDTYRSHTWAQGFGSVWGYGLIADYGGNDIYYAGGRYIHHPLLPDDYKSFAQGFGMGWRPYAAGGIGFLYDAEGNDFYDAEVFAQATSYWYSIGMIVDRSGNDRYLAAQYAQGSGIHLSVGILIDSEGDDHYVSKYGPGQGEGHDFAVGVLMDKQGDDVYCMSGGQGIGLTNSVGIFIDSQGKDTYATREKNTGQGSGTWARGFGSAGIFLDLMQKDSYPEMSPGDDDRIWTQGTYGVGIDVHSDSTPEEPEFEMQPVPDLEDMTIEEVFEEASMWEVREAKDRVRAGRKELIERGMEAVSYVIENEIDTRSGLALRAISELADSLPDSIAPYLMDVLDDERFWARVNAIYLLGGLKWKPAIDPLLDQIERPGNKKRSAISALGRIGEKRVAPKIAEYLRSDDEPTRISAAVALSRLKDDRTIPALVAALDDEQFTVRSAVENALVGLGQASLAHLIHHLKKGNTISLPNKIRAVSRIAKKGDSGLKRRGARAIRPYLSNENRTVRIFAVDGLSGLGDTETLKWMAKKEKDELVLSRYKHALKSKSQ